MPVGGFADFEVHPTCGLVGASGTIGMFDDARSFYEPERVDAQLLWFHHGWVELPVSESCPPWRADRQPAAQHGGLFRGTAPQRELAVRHHRVRQRRPSGRMDEPRRLRRPTWRPDSRLVEHGQHTVRPDEEVLGSAPTPAHSSTACACPTPPWMTSIWTLRTSCQFASQCRQTVRTSRRDQHLRQRVRQLPAGHRPASAVHRSRKSDELNEIIRRSSPWCVGVLHGPPAR